ncbi:MAG: hypothetical protein BGO39_20750 [Chloroflexi bacterium 54-19]|nr:MAG: hypothetical protein BGO39_20750 [Chloroflexi bacterium 54-19]
MAVQVDEWKMTQARVLRAAAAEYSRLAQQLEGTLSNLSNINNNVFNAQVSGPPNDFLRNLWNEWNGQTNPLVPRLHNLVSDLNRQAGQWEQSYRSQKQAAEAESRRLAEEATRCGPPET